VKIKKKDEKVKGEEVRNDAEEMLRRITEISLHGYTDRTVTISGSTSALYDLAKELKTWQPSGGWSDDAKRLFKALEDE